MIYALVIALVLCVCFIVDAVMYIVLIVLHRKYSRQVKESHKWLIEALDKSLGINDRQVDAAIAKAEGKG